jgi:hypothetical protein
LCTSNFFISSSIAIRVLGKDTLRTSHPVFVIRYRLQCVHTHHGTQAPV